MRCCAVSCGGSNTDRQGGPCWPLQRADHTTNTRTDAFKEFLSSHSGLTYKVGTGVNFVFR